MMSLDLEKQLAFYGAYHRNSVNVIVHMICVPLILLSAFCLATNTGPLIPLPDALVIPNLEPNLGTIAALIWGSLYVLLEPVAGTALAVLCLGGTAAVNSLRGHDPKTVNTVASVVHVACWILQFIGHGLFEKRAPALLDNLVQAVFLAPLFVWLELLFMLGYRPELRARVQKKADAQSAKFKATQKKD